AIRQKNTTRNPRSTVATQTEIYDYLRLLFARAGETICRKCGRVVRRDSPESAAGEVLSALDEGTRFYVLFPITQGDIPVTKKTKAKKKKDDGLSVSAFLISLLQQGFSRLFRDGETIELQKPEDYPYKDFNDTFVLIERLAAKHDIRGRLVDSLETCFRESHSALVQTTDSRQFKFSDSFVCKYDGTVYETPEPHLFSFNSPFGACPTCQGFGNTIGIDYGLVIPNPLLSIKE